MNNSNNLGFNNNKTSYEDHNNHKKRYSGRLKKKPSLRNVSRDDSSLNHTDIKK